MADAAPAAATVNLNLRKMPGMALDFGTIVGIGGAFSLITWALFVGGSIMSFADFPSVLIVLGGTVCTVIACFSVKEVFRTFRVTLKTMVRPAYTNKDVAWRIMQVADALRGQSFLALQGDPIKKLRGQPLLYKGLSMIIDGIAPKDAVDIMKQGVRASYERHAVAISVLQKSGELAPAMGVIGTIIGLIQMLGNLSDPTTIGPSMAVALITTFYGSMLSNLVFTPLASKLEKKSADELLTNQLYVLGVASMGGQENPRRTEMMLNAILPPAQQIRYFD